MFNFLILFLGLAFIVVSSSLFCNALEHLGEKLNISEGVTGSIFAAVGTALPETMIPILALLGMHSGATNHQIGVGAILGAPLMLSTLSLFVVAVSVIKQRGFSGRIRPENRGLKRDLSFFLFGYGLAIIAIFVQNLQYHLYFNIFITIVLGLSYFIYLFLTIHASSSLVKNGYKTKTSNKLVLEYIGFELNKLSITFQLILSLMMLIYFAGLFIDGVNNIASLYSVSPFILSLIIIPIATELPEKINSVLWLRNGKDTLAIGNITGAMVFQGTLLPIIGILFTDWKLTSTVHLAGVFITMLAGIWFYIFSRELKVWHFLVNGLLYCFNLVVCYYFFYG